MNTDIHTLKIDATLSKNTLVPQITKYESQIHDNQLITNKTKNLPPNKYFYLFTRC